MKNIGFLISEKENESRRALTINDFEKLRNKKNVFFQNGYFEKLGYSDEQALKAGCQMLSETEVLETCDIICDPKIGDSELLNKMKNKTIFGWIHATQNFDITQSCIDSELTVYAWEKMNDENGHVFYKNNQIAGEAAVMHAMLLYGKKFENLNVAILGNGNTSKGAQRILNKFNANIEIFDINQESEFKSKLSNFDVIVNCILWDVTRNDHIIYKEDLNTMKLNSLIIDVSCDKCGGIESSIPTTIDNPTYIENGILHYVVDHTPSLLFKDATDSISNEVVKYVDDLVEGNPNQILNAALIIENGQILDNEINEYQNR